MNSEKRPSSSIPVRNLLALWIAAVVGFFLGLLEALDRMPYGQTIHIAEVGVAIALLAAALGGVREQGRIAERLFVSLLRVGLSGGVFAFVFEGMRLLLKIGVVGGAVASWIWAGILALLLVRLAPPARVPSVEAEQPRKKAADQAMSRTSLAAGCLTQPGTAITRAPAELTRSTRSAANRGRASHQRDRPREPHASSSVESS